MKEQSPLDFAITRFLADQEAGAYASIELHDSEISEITGDGSVLVVRFDPAYVHKTEGNLAQPAKQEGWLIPAEMVFTNGSIVEGTQKQGEVSDGHLECEDNIVDNLIPVPFSDLRPVKLFLYFVSGDKVEIHGSSVAVRLTGEGKFLENNLRRLQFGTEC